MKLIMAIVALAVTAGTASAQYLNNNNRGSSYGNSGLSGTGSNSNSHVVSPYTNSHGTTVQSGHATNPNNTQTDNYTATGNVNPYTGAVGTRQPRY